MFALFAALWRYRLVLVIGAALAGSFWFGYRTARNADLAASARALARAQAAEAAAAKAANDREAARLDAQAAHDLLARQLEDAAHADPVTAPACLPADRVRRLNRL